MVVFNFKDQEENLNLDRKKGRDHQPVRRKIGLACTFSSTSNDNVPSSTKFCGEKFWTNYIFNHCSY